MAEKWTDIESAQLVIKRMLPKLTQMEDGHWGLSGPGIERSLLAMESIVRFDSRISATEKGSVVFSAVLKAAEAGRFNQGGISEEIKREEQKRLRRKSKDFTLLTSLSVKLPKSLRQRRLAEGTIRFHKSKPGKFDTSLADTHQSSLFLTPLPTNYTYVSAQVSARDEIQASQKALATVDLLRGIWNLFYNRGKGMRWISGRKLPLNGIVLGPLHTIHLPTGEKSGDLYWWEPGYYKETKPIDLEKEYETLKIGEKRLRAQIEACAFKRYQREAVLRYVRALDEPNMSTALLKLWGALEYTTNTGNDAQKTSDRALFIFKDRAYHKIVLERLRKERNRFAHEGSESQEAERNLCLLNLYASEALFFLLSEGKRFKSVEEYAQVLDLTQRMPELSAILLDRKREVGLLKLVEKWFDGKG